MSELVWHDMSEERPKKGRNDYLVLGVRGGLYLANAFTGYDDNNVWFKDMHGNHLYPEKVLAWAEVPPYDGPKEV